MSEAAMEDARAEQARRWVRIASWALAAGFLVVAAAVVGTIRESYRTSQREARVFASDSAAAFAQGFCDRALRLAVAGLPPAKGAALASYRSPQLQGDLSYFASANGCPFQLALSAHRKLVN